MHRNSIALACLGCAAGCLFADGDAPLPFDDYAAIAEDEPMIIRILDNDRGADVLEWVSSAEHGAVEQLDDDTVRYRPERERSGEDAFFYVVSNEHGTARARVTVRVEPDSSLLGEPRVVLTAEEPLQPFAADFDRDQSPDIVAAGSSKLLALLDDDKEGWREVASFEGSSVPPVIVDLDQNGTSDIVMLDETPTVLLTEAIVPGERVAFEPIELRYSGPDAIEVPDLPEPFLDRPTAGAAGDLDGDARIDLAIAYLRMLIVHFDLRSGRPARSVLLELPDLEALAIGDVSGDGIGDLAMLVDSVVTVLSFDEGGAARVIAKAELPVAPSPMHRQLLAGALDIDAPDELLVTAEGRLIVFDAITTEDGLELESWSTTTQLRHGALGQLHGDRSLELVAVHETMLEIWTPTRRDGATLLERVGDFRLDGWPFWPPIVLPIEGRFGVLAHRHDVDAHRHELVVLRGED